MLEMNQSDIESQPQKTQQIDSVGIEQKMKPEEEKVQKCRVRNDKSFLEGTI